MRKRPWHDPTDVKPLDVVKFGVAASTVPDYRAAMLGRMAVACRGLRVAGPEVQKAFAGRIGNSLIDLGNGNHREFSTGGLRML